MSAMSAPSPVLHHTARTALCSPDGTLAGWSQLLIVIFQFSHPSWQSTRTRLGWNNFNCPATSSSVDPALPIEAFYLGNFKGRDGVPRAHRRLT